MSESVLGNRLKTLRGNRTLEEIGALVGLAKTTLHGYESGRREPDLNTLQKLANALGTTVAYLIGDTEDPRPKPLHIERRDMPLPPPGWDKLTPEEQKEVEERARSYEEFEVRRILREKGHDV